MNNELKCVNLESGLRVGTNGFCSSCCMMKHQFKNKSERLNVKNSSFDKILNSESRKEIVKDFKNGIKNSACQYCWDEEAAGKMSKRLRDNKRFANKNKKDTVQLLDLNMGNTCNIKCRTCGPFNSSKWAKEWKDLGLFEGTDSEYKELLNFFNNSFNDDSLFWKSFENSIKDILHIDFYGGEPFLVKKQWEMLKKSIELDYAKDLSIHYNTNGTIWNDEIFDILNEFKKVYIDFSIDGIENKLFYIRHPAEWRNVYQNFKNVNKYNHNDKFHISVCNTISILNVYYIDELVDVFSQHTQNMYLNLVFGPEHYCITNIPDNIKHKIKDKLEKTVRNVPVDNIINFMFSKKCEDKEWQKFLELTKRQDEYRNENFQQTFPEFYDIIKQSGYQL